MKLNSFESVKQLTENMVAIPSINKELGGESAVARYMQDFYMSLPYFQAHPEQVKCFQTKNDFVVRHSTLAYVKGTKVQRLCKGNRIEGVMNINRVWLIPKNAEKPADARKKLMKN